MSSQKWLNKFILLETRQKGENYVFCKTKKLPLCMRVFKGGGTMGKTLKY